MESTVYCQDILLPMTFSTNKRSVSYLTSLFRSHFLKRCVISQKPVAQETYLTCIKLTKYIVIIVIDSFHFFKKPQKSYQIIGHYAIYLSMCRVTESRSWFLQSETLIGVTGLKCWQTYWAMVDRLSTYRRRMWYDIKQSRSFFKAIFITLINVSESQRKQVI